MRNFPKSGAFTAFPGWALMPSTGTRSELSTFWQSFGGKRLATRPTAWVGEPAGSTAKSAHANTSTIRH